MLQGLSYFEHIIKRDSNQNRTPKEAFSWGSTDRDSLARCILSICHTAYDIISKEPRLIHVTAPAYVLGLLLKFVIICNEVSSLTLLNTL